MESNWLNIFGMAGIGGLALAAVVYVFKEVIRKEIFPTLTKQHAYDLLYRIVLFSFILGVLGILAYFGLNFSRESKTGNPNNNNAPPSTDLSSPVTNNQNLTSSNIYNSNTQISKSPDTNNKMSNLANSKGISNTNQVLILTTPSPPPLTSVVMGTVVDKDGKSLKGAKVAIEDFPDLPPVETNSDGNFRLINIPKESGEGIRIRIFKEGYQEVNRDVVIGARPRKIYLESIGEHDQ